MNSLERSANCIIRQYPDARARAVCQNGLTAIYFIHGGFHGTRWIQPCAAGFNPRLFLGDETYRLKIFREKRSPMYKYPFYVLKP